MAKGQKRSNREPKKPKKAKKPGAAPVQAIPSRDARTPRVFGRKPA